MTNTISKVKMLEELIKIGLEDKVISKTIDKLAQYKVEQLKKDIAEIKSKLKKFEEMYKMNSKNFTKKYEAGALGDDMNFIQWSSLYDVQERIEKRLKAVGAKGA